MQRRLDSVTRLQDQSNTQFDFEIRAEANLVRPSRIWARDQAANPKVSAGFSSVLMKQDDSGDGLIPISAQTRVTSGKSSFRRNQATKCNPASAIWRVKYSLSSLLNCSMKKSLRSEYSFRIRLIWLRKYPSVRNRASVA